MGIVDDEFDGMGLGHPGPRFPQVRFNAIGEAWGLILGRWPLWILTVAIVLVANSMLEGAVYSFFDVKPVGGAGPFWIGLSPKGHALQFILGTALNGIFLGGMFRMACQQVRGRDIGLGTFFGTIDAIPQVLLGSIVYGLATFLGFCVFVLPGFVVSGVLMFTLPLIVDGGLEATDALAQSWHALKRQWLTAAVFHLAAGFVAWLGVCLCGVGIVLTAPIYCMSIAILYRDFFMAKGA
jgi:hypothetical protein